MNFENKLISGVFIKRYKRFFVDVQIENKVITAHCPNTGSMKGLLQEGNKVWLSTSNNPDRKLKYTPANYSRTSLLKVNIINDKIYSLNNNSELKIYNLNDKKDIETYHISISSNSEFSYPTSVAMLNNFFYAEIQNAVRKWFLITILAPTLPPCNHTHQSMLPPSPYVLWCILGWTG